MAAPLPTQLPLPTGTAAAPTEALWVAGLASAVGGLVHLALVPDHAAESAALGAAFALCGVAQLAVGGMLLRRPGARGWGEAAVVLNLGVVAAWLLSRTAGLPVGHPAWTPEAFGVLDVATSACETVAAVGVVLALSGRRALATALSPVTLLLAAVALSDAGAGGHH